MSNSLAIAAVTATLSNLLNNGLKAEPEIADGGVTTKPPNKARSGDTTGNQLNLFLYHVEHTAAWHDESMPGQGPDAMPPLALTLYYLLTAYGQGDDDIKGHQLLGRGMRTLLDNPTLPLKDIEAALPKNDLFQQVERARVTRQPISLDEMSKLWSTFQTEYRISVAYQVSVILIESLRSAQAALPILRRGSTDRGVISQSDTIPPFPTITDITIVMPGLANTDNKKLKRESAQLGDYIRLVGHHLTGKTVMVRLNNPRLRTSMHLLESEDIQVDKATDEEVTFTLPDNDPAKYPAGVYTVSVVVTETREFVTRTTLPDNTVNEVKVAYDNDYVSNELAIAIAPQVTTAGPIMPVADPDDNTMGLISMTCKPLIRIGQRVSLFLNSPGNSYELKAQATDNVDPTDTLAFIFKKTLLEKGDYRLRLRVDGVDSFIVNTQTHPPSFNDEPKVTVI